ncbi:MAG: mercury methylation corrinoid protein HgcA [Thermodesulfobacteriota bacterium]
MHNLDDAKDSGEFVEACCGSPPGPKAGEWVRPGYRLYPFVTGFVYTASGWIPQLSTRLGKGDKFAAFLIRLGFKGESHTTLSPGLYCTGSPDQNSPVLVTANYRLSLDSLRRELSGVDAWVLVLDTRGINVWCAAGKELFSTREVVRMVQKTGLKRVVGHRRLILPQFGATGVNGREVRKRSSFSVVWGPIRAEDIPSFLEKSRADTGMRRVTFTLRERAELIPVEFSNFGKKGLLVLLFFFLLSGVGPEVFSLSSMYLRGLIAAGGIAFGAIAGLVLLPLLLPWLPGRAFAHKAAYPGLGLGLLFLFLAWGKVTLAEGVCVLFLSTVISSFLGMHFTGSTPYTSPSGVEKEMKRALPLQGAGAVLAVCLWITTAFI